MKILIVEDIKAIAIGMSRTLQKAGHTTDMALNGREALEYLNNNNPDLILCDLIMPVLDGYQFTRTALQNNPELKIVIISAQPYDQGKAEMTRLGALDYFQKPITADALLNIIKQHDTQLITKTNEPIILEAPSDQAFDTHIKSCYICGSDQVRVFVPKPQAFKVDWNFGFFPNYTVQDGFQAWDFLKTAIFVCPSCMFASGDPDDFAHRGETENFPYKADAKKILTLSISTRKRIISPDADISEDHRFDKSNRSLENVLLSLQLAEKCANGLVLGDKMGSYSEIGYYYMLQGILDRSRFKEKMREALNSFLDQLKIPSTPRDISVKCFYFSVVLYLTLGESIKANEQKEALEKFYKEYDPKEASPEERLWNQRLLHIWQHGVDTENHRDLF